MSTFTELLWAVIGLLLTIGGTFLGAFIAAPSFSGGSPLLQMYSLGVTYQVGAVLLVGCLGGRNAGALSQIAYLLLGLTWFPIFSQGGGALYVREPSFGYLLGFVPGAWICGYLAFKALPRLESLVFSCLCGLAVIHCAGVGYLLVTYPTGWLNVKPGIPLLEILTRLSIVPLPGQLAIVCAVAVVAFTVRQLMFY